MTLNANIGIWANHSALPPRTFTCGYSACGKAVGSHLGWQYHDPQFTRAIIATIYICPMCQRPTFFDDTDPSMQMPGISFGRAVDHLPKDIDELYGEIRNATSAQAYTSAVLSCRKMLMHIAVEKGAEENNTFAFYIKYLADNHYAPPGSEAWVAKIKNSGNEANHEIKIMTKDEAEELVTFVQMLLTFIYEFPKKISGAN